MYQKEFILRSKVPCRVSFCSMTLDSRVHAWGEGGTKSKISSKHYLLNMVFLSKSYMKAFILGALGTQ